MKKSISTKLMTGAMALVIILLTSACNKDEPEPLEPISFTLDGFWDLQRMLSDKAVDLDFDGIYSNDIIVETGGISALPNGMTKGPWWPYDYHMQFESRNIGVNNEYPGGHEGYIQLVKFYFPKPSVIVDKNDNMLLNVLFGATNEIFSVRYSERKGLLEKFRHSPESAPVHEITLNFDGSISINYEQEFYSLKDREFYMEDGWETLNITATYRKREE